MLVAIYNHIILIPGDSVLLGGLKLVDEILDVFDVDSFLMHI